MKWFKHMSDASDTVFIQEAEARFGDAGYSVWFKLLELISKENGNELTGRVEVSVFVLCQKLRKRETSVDQLLNFYSTQTSLTWDKNNQKYIIEIPKLLRLQDNYQKDLQASSKKLSLELRTKSKEYSTPLTPLENKGGTNGNGHKKEPRKLTKFFWKSLEGAPPNEVKAALLKHGYTEDQIKAKWNL